MKLAICLSGHMRSYKQTFSSLYHFIISQYDCDIFIVTYPNLGSSFSHITSDIPFKESEINIDNIKLLYKPFAIKILDDLEAFSYYNPLYKGLNIGMFRAIQEANELVKLSNKKYDLVLRIRPDLEIKKFDISNLDYSKVNVPVKAKVWDNGITDQIAISTPLLMDTYSSFYSNINVIKSLPGLQHPEIKLKEWLFKNQILVNYIDVNWNIIRLNSEIIEQK